MKHPLKLLFPLSFDLYNQPIRKELNKAFLFHGFYLLMVVFGFIVKNDLLDSDSGMIKYVYMFYWFIGIAPMISIIMYNTIAEDEVNFLFWPESELYHLSIIRTFREFCRDLSWFKQIVFSVILPTSSFSLGLIFFNAYPDFPLLWLMGAFFIYMLYRYVRLLAQVRNSKIVLNARGIIFPLLNTRKRNAFFMAWSDIALVEIIGSEQALYASNEIYLPFEQNITFIRGIIINYEHRNKKLFVITDAILDCKNMWLLYVYSSHYISQHNLKLRLIDRNSPLNACRQEDLSGVATMLASIRLKEAAHQFRLSDK